MNGVVWQRLDQAARALVPGATLLLTVLLSLLPIGLPGWGQVTPPFVLIAIFWWSLQRPAAVPPSIAFALGLLLDLASAAPLGATALLLVLTRWIVESQRRFLRAQSFFTVWCIFGLVALFAAGLEWSIYALLHLRIVSIEPGLVRAGLGVALFPVLVKLVLLPAQRFVATES